MARRPETLIYGVGDRPPLATTFFLGLQQVALMSIYLVMIVIVVRASGAAQPVAESAVAFGLFAMGLSAALQALPRGPVGSGYLAPPVISAIYLPPSLLAVKVGGLPAVAGMTVLAGLFEIGLSRVLHRLRLLFPPLVCGFIVAAVGFELGLIGIEQLLDVTGRASGHDVPRHVAVALLTLSTMVALSVWGRGMLRLLCSLAGIAVGFAAAGIAGLIEPAALHAVVAAPVVALPRLPAFAYRVEPGLLVPFLLAGLAAGLRTIGVVTTCQQINDAEWKRPDLRPIEGGVLADGIGCAVGGLLGSVGMGSAPSLVGVSQASGATSRVIAFAVAGLCAVLACFPKLAAVFLALPPAVVSGGLVFTASFMIAGGLQIIAARKLDTRKTFIVSVSLLLGLSRAMSPAYYERLPHLLQAVSGSLLSLSMVTAIGLNLLFHMGLRRAADVVLETTGTDTAAPAATLSDLVRQSARKWGVGGDVSERARAVAEQVLHLILDGRLADGPITARVTYDEVTVAVEIEYRGDLLSFPARRPASEENLVEEQPFVTGLAGFLAGLYPDRVRASTSDGRCRIALLFDA